MSISEEIFEKIYTELETGIRLPKCQKCGCMGDFLQTLTTALPDIPLTEAAKSWREQMQPIQYSCLGCEHCYPAVAQNQLSKALPDLDAMALSCDFQTVDDSWPPVVGEYFVLDSSAPVAVSTLASVDLAETLAQQSPPGLAIVGKTETENIGLDKIIKNVITNPALRYLILCGTDSKGHQTGKTLLALSHKGTDKKQRVIEAPSKRAFLRNVLADEIQQFRDQIQMIDMIGCQSVAEIQAQIEDLAASSECGCCSSCCETPSPPARPVSSQNNNTTQVTEPEHPIQLDKAGYFVIVPLPKRGVIHVEYYSYENELLHTLEGESAKAIYMALIEREWVTELSHAAYLGKELAKAELSLQHGLSYIQDGA